MSERRSHRAIDATPRRHDGATVASRLKILPEGAALYGEDVHVSVLKVEVRSRTFVNIQFVSVSTAILISHN